MREEPAGECAERVVAAATDVGNVALAALDVRVVVGREEHLLGQDRVMAAEEVVGGAIAAQGQGVAVVDPAVAVGVTVGETPAVAGTRGDDPAAGLAGCAAGPVGVSGGGRHGVRIGDRRA